MSGIDDGQYCSGFFLRSVVRVQVLPFVLLCSVFGIEVKWVESRVSAVVLISQCVQRKLAMLMTDGTPHRIMTRFIPGIRVVAVCASASSRHIDL